MAVINRPEAASRSEVEQTASKVRLVTFSFTLSSFLGSFLLFLVQPLAAKTLLPHVGGSPALWNTALVFFQSALLFGYLFAHGATKLAGSRRHPALHLTVLVLPLLALPLALPDEWIYSSTASPSVWILAALTVMVGAPFFALATSSPTLQRWLSWTDHPDAQDPYFLYSAGNIGSVIALVGYPFVFERMFTLSEQAAIWSGIYVLFVVSVGGSALLCADRRSTAEAIEQHNPALPWSRRVRWVGFSAAPSALLVAVTQFLSVDLAPFPLLWVLPLLLYLLTFVIVFRRSGVPSAIWPRRVVFGLAPLVGIFGVLTKNSAVPLWSTVSLALAWFFAGALTVHIKLSADRPSPSKLTEYFAFVSLGGALGGGSVALLAPVIFSFNAELVLSMAAILLLSVRFEGERPVFTGLPVGAVLLLMGVIFVLMSSMPISTMILMGFVPSLLAAAFIGRQTTVAMASIAILAIPMFVVRDTALFQDRSFFGIYAVTELDGNRTITSGTTVHGSQLLRAPGIATTYYAPFGPVGDILGARDRDRVVGVVGLGAGAIAAYGQIGDNFTFYEIDPLVVQIAEDPSYFTYLSDSSADVSIEVGDGRSLLASETASFDVLAIDAFTSDAIPVHLLTNEAFNLYAKRLTTDGILLIHISNRHIDLQPVLGRIAEEQGLVALVREYEPTPEQTDQGARQSIWVAMAKSEDELANAIGQSDWVELEAGGRLWTDDYADLVGAIDW